MRLNQIAQKKAQLTAELNEASSQLAAIGQRMAELDLEIQEKENLVMSLEAIRRVTAPLISERNGLVEPYNELVRRKNNLIEQLNLLNLM